MEKLTGINSYAENCKSEKILEDFESWHKNKKESCKTIDTKEATYEKNLSSMRSLIVCDTEKPFFYLIPQNYFDTSRNQYNSISDSGVIMLLEDQTYDNLDFLQMYLYCDSQYETKDEREERKQHILDAKEDKKVWKNNLNNIRESVNLSKEVVDKFDHINLVLHSIRINEYKLIKLYEKRLEIIAKCKNLLNDWKEYEHDKFNKNLELTEKDIKEKNILIAKLKEARGLADILLYQQNKKQQRKCVDSELEDLRINIQKFEDNIESLVDFYNKDCRIQVISISPETFPILFNEKKLINKSDYVKKIEEETDKLIKQNVFIKNVSQKLLLLVDHPIKKNLTDFCRKRNENIVACIKVLDVLYEKETKERIYRKDYYTKYKREVY